MKTILVINDNTAQSEHAAEFALKVAQKHHADLLIATTCKAHHEIVETILAVNSSSDEGNIQLEYGLIDHLTDLNNEQVGFKASISEIDISEMDETQVSEFVIRNDIWMIVKGMAEYTSQTNINDDLNVNKILNRVRCPLFLIPQGWETKDIERLIYIADLRYCRVEIVRYLAELAAPWKSALSVAHVSASGIPDLVDGYAQTLFSEEIGSKVRYDQLFFNNIREKDLNKAVDIMINGMHNDIMVLVNHRFHFEEIVGRRVNDALPANIQIPLLVFPY